MGGSAVTAAVAARPLSLLIAVRELSAVKIASSDQRNGAFVGERGVQKLLLSLGLPQAGLLPRADGRGRPPGSVICHVCPHRMTLWYRVSDRASKSDGRSLVSIEG